MVELIRDGVTLRGTVTGTGPTVLLLHAGGERRTVWTPIAAALAAHGLRAVAYDLRGHGESSGRATTLPPIAADVTAMIHREPEPIVVVGASLGGVAAVSALAEPVTARRVAGLVLVDTVPNQDPGRVRAWLDELGLLDLHAELVEDILGRGPDLLAAAAAIRVPIHLARGGRSPLTDADEQRLRATCPGAGVSMVPGAGHLIAREAPEELARVVLDQASTWLGPLPPSWSGGDRSNADVRRRR